MTNPLTQEAFDRFKETMKLSPLELPEMKPFDPDEFLGDYLTKGFYSFSAKKLLQAIEIQRFETVKVKHDDNCFHAEGHEFHSEYMRLSIEQLGRELGRILKDTPGELQFDFYTDSVNDHVQMWHSDAQYAMPGQNATVNCFFSNTNESIGGRFDMAPYSADIIGTKKLPGYFTSIYPQCYDIVIFNQNRNFLHKAIPSVLPRRMVSFACTLENINPLLPNWQA